MRFHFQTLQKLCNQTYNLHIVLFGHWEKGKFIEWNGDSKPLSTKHSHKWRREKCLIWLSFHTWYLMKLYHKCFIFQTISLCCFISECVYFNGLAYSDFLGLVLIRPIYSKIIIHCLVFPWANFSGQV